MRPRSMRITAGAVLLVAASGFGQSLVNWETPHVHPLDMTPDRTRLLAVNTADARLEVFDVRSGRPVPLLSIAVGLDPVSVRARNDAEAWVVNHVSDSVSVVNLSTGNVVRTLRTEDEPADVVFAGSPQRAFVTCSQPDKVLVFDPANPAAAPVTVPIDGEDPRAMAVSPDGSKVYVAIFESGNRSTILGGGSVVTGMFPPNAVSDAAGPYGGVNPPPNRGSGFDPPLNPANAPPPPVGLIVRQDGSARWMDDNAGEWTDLVSGANASLSGRPTGWDLKDHDVAVVDAASLQVGYFRHLMNLCMALAVRPGTGQIAVVGTDAINHIRFEPNLNGRFLRVDLALAGPAPFGSPTIVDLNPHLTYTASTIPPAGRSLSIGDPRGIVWNAAGTRAYVTGMGSNNVLALDAAGSRVGPNPAIGVGKGPTGVALDEARGRLYVLNKFDATISTIDTASWIELPRTAYFDPTPAAIRAGRPHLYDTHRTSGLGHLACASCHVDARIDRLAWDLGNPAGQVRSFDQNCNFGSTVLGPGPCPPWHPMKGPMVTQTLQDIIGKEPHHWRGDRRGLEEFNQTFTNLQGADAMLSPAEMQEFEDFLATVTFPPNPFRGADNALPLALPLPGHVFTGLGGAPGQPLPNGDARSGSALFRNHHLIPGFQLSCNECHTLPTGMGTNQNFSGGSGVPSPPGPDGELHHAVVFSSKSESPSISIKAPHLRNLYEKVGFDLLSTSSRAGFGFMHDGSVDSLARFMSEPFFTFGNPADGPPSTKIPAMVAYMLAFSGSEEPVGTGIPLALTGPLSKDTHAAAGLQLTVDGSNRDAPTTAATLNEWMGFAEAQPVSSRPGPTVGLVARGVRAGLARGYAYTGGGTFQADRSGETVTADALRSSSNAGAELTFTVVPRGTQSRVAIDRDEDGVYDRVERDACSDPADPGRVPVPGDTTVPALQVSRQGTSLWLSWSDQGVSHDVIRGDLGILRSTGGDFTGAVQECLANDLLSPRLTYSGPYGPGAMFFLVRSSCQGGGETYESSGPGQAGERNAEIGASPASCPSNAN